jgi:hypothetical protein
MFLEDALPELSGYASKRLFETTMKALREANFPDEIAHFRNMLLKLSLTPTEQEVLWEKIG